MTGAGGILAAWLSPAIWLALPALFLAQGSEALWAGLLVVAAPLLARHRANRNVQGFVKGAYAAAIGTILGACVLLGRIAIGDWLTIFIGVAALVALFRWKVSNPLLMAVTAVAGLIAFPLLHPAWVMVK